MKAGEAINAMFAGMALAGSNPMPYFASDAGGVKGVKVDKAKQKRKAKIAAQSKRRNRK